MYVFNIEHTLGATQSVRQKKETEIVNTDKQKEEGIREAPTPYNTYYM